jgi:predicted DNA-binding WGR domain protein
MPPAAITMTEAKDTKFRKRSRSEANVARNFEKIQKQAQESVKKYDKPLKDKRANAAKTDYEKERVWQAWVWYALMTILPTCP